MPSSRGSSWPRDWTCTSYVSSIGGGGGSLPQRYLGRPHRQWTPWVRSYFLWAELLYSTSCHSKEVGNHLTVSFDATLLVVSLGLHMHSVGPPYSVTCGWISHTGLLFLFPQAPWISRISTVWKRFGRNAVGPDFPFIDLCLRVVWPAMCNSIQFLCSLLGNPAIKYNIPPRFFPTTAPIYLRWTWAHRGVSHLTTFCYSPAPPGTSLATLVI